MEIPSRSGLVLSLWWLWGVPWQRQKVNSAVKLFQAQPRQPQAVLDCAWETLIKFVLEQFHTPLQSVLIAVARPLFPLPIPFPTTDLFLFLFFIL